MFEAFLELLQTRQKSKEIVWTADISYWMDGREFRGQSDPAWNSEEGYLRFCRELGIMPYYWYRRQFWLAEPVYDEHVRVETTVKGRSTKRSWSTPLGEIWEVHTFMPESMSTAPTKFPIGTKKDLDVFNYIIDHRTLTPASIDDYHERMLLWPRYDGIPSIAMPRSPLAAFFYEWAGVERGVFLLMDHRETVTEIFSKMEAQEDPVIAAVSRLAPPVVHFADNLSSDNMGSFYDELMAPGHRRRIERFHRIGTSCAVHLDGVVAGLLPKLAAVGFDAIEALTPSPGGDLAVENIRAVAKDQQVILWGGVPGILFAPPYRWEDVRAHVRRVLEAWGDTPFILGVADQVPPDGDIEYCKKISEVITS